MSRTAHDYQRRGCAIGSEIVTGSDSLLVATEPSALFLHWRKMAMLTLEAQPVDLGKLDYCVKHMRFWQQHLEITR